MYVSKQITEKDDRLPNYPETKSLANPTSDPNFDSELSCLSSREPQFHRLAGVAIDPAGLKRGRVPFSDLGKNVRVKRSAPEEV